MGAQRRAWGFRYTPKLALCSGQESPLQLSPCPPAVRGAWFCLLAERPSPGTHAHRHRLFLNGDHRDPLGQLLAIQGAPAPWPFLPLLLTH